MTSSVELGKVPTAPTVLGKVPNMRTVKTLIRDAIDATGSQAELATRLGVSPSEVSKLVNGKLPASPQTVGLLCEAAKVEPAEARAIVAQAIVDAAKDASRKTALRKAFFAAATWGGVALSTMLGTAAPTDAQASAAQLDAAPQHHRLYIM